MSKKKIIIASIIGVILVALFILGGKLWLFRDRVEESTTGSEELTTELTTELTESTDTEALLPDTTNLTAEQTEDEVEPDTDAPATGNPSNFFTKVDVNGMIGGNTNNNATVTSDNTGTVNPAGTTNTDGTAEVVKPGVKTGGNTGVNGTTGNTGNNTGTNGKTNTSTGTNGTTGNGSTGSTGTNTGKTNPSTGNNTGNTGNGGTGSTGTGGGNSNTGSGDSGETIHIDFDENGNGHAGTGGETAKPAHKHEWSEVYKTVHHDAVYETVTEEAWDEDVKVGKHCFCNGCGLDLTITYGTADCEAAGDHLSACNSGYHTAPVYKTVHHDAVTYEVCTKEAWDEEVFDHVECLTCGATASSWAEAKKK